MKKVIVLFSLILMFSFVFADDFEYDYSDSSDTETTDTKPAPKEEPAPLALPADDSSSSDSDGGGSGGFLGDLAVAFTLPVAAQNTIWGRYFLSKKMAVEFGFLFHMQTEKKDNNVITQNGGFRMGIQGAFMSYLSTGRISPYWKAGGLMDIKSGDEFKNNDDFGFALFGGLGTEFKVVEDVFSIGGETLLWFDINPFISFDTFVPNIYAVFYF